MVLPGSGPAVWSGIPLCSPYRRRSSSSSSKGLGDSGGQGWVWRSHETNCFPV